MTHVPWRLMRLRTKTRWFPLLLAAVLAAGCAASPKPRKYKKKRGCDCPRWNHVPAAPKGAAHAGLWHFRRDDC